MIFLPFLFRIYSCHVGHTIERCSFFPYIAHLMLQNVVNCIGVPAEEVKASYDSKDVSMVFSMHNALTYMNQIMLSVLHDFRVIHTTIFCEYWILSHLLSGFSFFIMHEYDD